MKKKIGLDYLLIIMDFVYQNILVMATIYIFEYIFNYNKSAAIKNFQEKKDEGLIACQFTALLFSKH